MSPKLQRKANHPSEQPLATSRRRKFLALIVAIMMILTLGGYGISALFQLIH